MSRSFAPTAILFPGQGSQGVGMGVDLRAASPRADALFRLADQITGQPISDLCAYGPLEALTGTEIAQTAIVVTSLAAAALLEDLLGSAPWSVAAVAGHSVGEIAAMCWAEAIDAETAIRLVHERGRLMSRDSAACDGGMAAVLGLDHVRLAEICSAASTDAARVQVANINAPGQVVISGDRGALDAAAKLALGASARRVVPLVVGGPFHSAYMAPAAADFRRTLGSVRFRAPRVPILLNTNAQPSMDPESFADELAKQIVSPVCWEQSLQTMAQMGCETFVELGAGQVLSGLVRRTLPDARVYAAGTSASVYELVGLWNARTPAPKSPPSGREAPSQTATGSGS